MNSKSLLLSLFVAVCLSFPLSLTAAEYTVGPGGTWATLNALRTSGVLADGDTIIVNGNDNSLTGSFTTSLTLQGGDIICPRLLSDNTKSITLDSNSVVIRNNYLTNSGGGAILANTVNILGGTNTFFNNTTTNLYSGGAISAVTNISGGTNLFENNNAAGSGGAISGRTTISGGTNTFSGNRGTGINSNGGAISSANPITISGGTNTFTGNRTGNLGGAIYTSGDLTLRASDGDFTFRGNQDRVGTVSQKANAIHANVGGGTHTLAAESGQSIYFYDPITTGVTAVSSININPWVTDTGKVVFDGSNYAGLDAANRHSAVFGNTTVGNGTLALQGDVVYGLANNRGTFTLGKNATLLTDASTNRIQANTITMNGAVGINSGGTLELAAALGVNFNGTMYVGLGLDDFTSGTLSILGNLTFGNNAKLDLYWGDSFVPTENWKQTYDMSALFTATGSMNGFDKLMFDASWFDAYDGFSYEWLGDGILSLSYTASEVPEPATLLMLGLAVAGLPIVHRLRRG